jgi:RNA methyltransferase, TrmH family
MERLTSTSNARIRAYAGLARARTRREQGRHLVEGPNAVAEALAAGVVDEVFCTDERMAAAVPSGIPVTLVDEAVLAKLADAVTPQGVVAVARSRTVALDEVVGDGVLVVLDRVADPGNAGTIVRSADALGANGVVLTAGSVDVFGPKAVRAAVGSTYHLGIVTGVDLGEVVQACRAVGQRIVGLDAGGAELVGQMAALDGPLALVLGNEAHGLDDTAASASFDATVAIPLHPRAESLNVAAAAAIAIHAAVRGRDTSTRLS